MKMIKKREKERGVRPGSGIRKRIGCIGLLLSKKKLTS